MITVTGILEQIQVTETKNKSWIAKVTVDGKNYFTKFYAKDTIPKALEQFYVAGDKVEIVFEAGNFSRLLEMKRLEKSKGDPAEQELKKFLGS